MSPLEGGAVPALTLRIAPRAEDRDRVAALLTATGFFRPDEIAIGGELIDDRLAQGAASGYEFLFADAEAGLLLGYACFGPVPLTLGSWDLYWIAVDPSAQGSGLGRRILVEAERRIAASGGERIFVDTSGREQYLPTRAFYQRCGYVEAARLEDFYAPGDAKVVFRKALTGA